MTRPCDNDVAPGTTPPARSEDWVAATEEDATLRGGFTKTVMVGPGVRLFRVSDELAAKALLDWSEPVQLKLEKQADGTYELIARTVPQ